MNSTHEHVAAPSIDGNLLHLGEAHWVAIYRREGSSWVAEFRNGHCQLTDAATWFRVPAGALMSCHRWRAATLDTMQALTPELIDRIEQLHRRREHRPADRREALPAAAGTVERWLSTLARIVARTLRGRAAGQGTPA